MHAFTRLGGCLSALIYFFFTYCIDHAISRKLLARLGKMRDLDLACDSTVGEAHGILITFFLPLLILFYGSVMLADARPGRTEELCYDPYVRRPSSIGELERDVQRAG